MAVSTDLPRRASRTALPTGCQPFPSLAFSFLLLAMFLGPYAQGQHRFPIVPSYQTGGDAFKIVAVADFNKDGHEDALVLNFNYSTDPPSSFISLLLGDGHGGFGKPNTVLTNDVLPNQIRTGDFNGDGIPDIAVVTPANGTQVYLAKGDGTFHAASPTGALSNQSIELGPVGDFNGDGRLDLVVQDPANNRNLILLGKGNGNFSSSIASNVPAGSNYGPMVAGDFNQDGILDLAMSDGNSHIQIMLGDGRGVFRSGALIETRAIGVGSLIAADLEGNGKLSLAETTGIEFGDTFCDIGPGVAVLSQGANGSWHETDYPTGVDSESVQASDMNGDGRLDLVVANAFSSSVSILLNKGSGTLSPAVNYTPGPSFIDDLVVKDLNGDGKPDVLFIPFAGTLNVMVNQGGGRFLAGSLIDIGLLPTAMAVTDLNHDGIPDLALIGLENCAQGIPNQFITVLSQGGRALATKRVNYADDIWEIGLGDINGDGNTDAVLSGNPTSSRLTALLNNGKGAFSLAGHPYTDVADDAFALGNYNSDTNSDVATIVTTSSELQVLLGKGDGGFGSPATYRTGSSPVAIVQRDLNGDGHRDLVVANLGDNTVDVFLGTADGKFQPAKSYAAGNSPSRVAFGDFNRDGKVDLAVANITSVSILLGRGDGTFTSPHSFPVGDRVNYIAVADLRGNGDDDVVVVVDDNNPNMYVLSGDGKGSLSKPVRYSGSDNAVGIATGDFNGDGAVDVAVQNFASTGPTIFYNQGGTHISLVSSAKNIGAGQNVTFTATVLASIGGTGTPTGTVAFRSGSSLLGTGKLIGGRASFSTSKLSKGTHSIFASYWGDGNFNPHLSSVVSVSVGP